MQFGFIYHDWNVEMWFHISSLFLKDWQTLWARAAHPWSDWLLLTAVRMIFTGSHKREGPEASSPGQRQRTGGILGPTAALVLTKAGSSELFFVPGRKEGVCFLGARRLPEHPSSHSFPHKTFTSETCPPFFPIPLDQERTRVHYACVP